MLISLWPNPTHSSSYPLFKPWPNIFCFQSLLWYLSPSDLYFLWTLSVVYTHLSFGSLGFFNVVNLILIFFSHHIINFLNLVLTILFILVSLILPNKMPHASICLEISVKSVIFVLSIQSPIQTVYYKSCFCLNRNNSIYPFRSKKISIYSFRLSK